MNLNMDIMQKIYIETSVVSYYIADISENITVAAHQLATKRMWEKLQSYSVYISDTVIGEASKGDELLANQRLSAMSEFSVLPVDNAVKSLAKLFLSQKVIPEKCPEDALHIAVAAINNIDFIITWNFKHINNPFIIKRIEKIIQDSGYFVPVMCSPEEFIGENDE